MSTGALVDDLINKYKWGEIMKKLFVLSLIAVAALSLSVMAGTSSAVDLKGIAYVQTHGGHVAVVDLETGDLKRIVHGKPSDALTLSADKKTLYVFSLDGNAKEIDLTTGKQTEWVKLGQKHCGSNIAPDGSIWVSDMKDGKVYVYDPKTKKLADSFESGGKSICGITFSKDGKTAYVSDMPGGFISIIDVNTKKVTGKIEGVGNFIHRARISPDGTEIWQSEGNELKGGQPYGVGYAEAGTPGGVTIVDVKTGKVKDFILTGGNVHDVDFSDDGKYAIAGSRQIPERDDSALIVIDTKTKRVVKMYSACKKCHAAVGVTIPEDKDGGRPFLCGVEVAWGDKFPAACTE